MPVLTKWTDTEPAIYAATLSTADHGQVQVGSGETVEWRSTSGRCHVRLVGGVSWQDVGLHLDATGQPMVECSQCWRVARMLFVRSGNGRGHDLVCQTCAGVGMSWQAIYGRDITPMRAAVRAGRAGDVLEVVAAGGLPGLRARVALEDCGVVPRQVRPDHGNHRLAARRDRQAGEVVPEPSTQATVYVGAAVDRAEESELAAGFVPRRRR
jgi:hypothetical protein